MKNGITRIVLLTAAMAGSEILSAQTASGNSSYLLAGIITISVLLVLGVVMMVGDNLISIEARQAGLEKKGISLSVFPAWRELFSAKVPKSLDSEKVTVLKRGFTIKLRGEADTAKIREISTRTYALLPINFRGIAPIPKLDAEIGTHVKIGDPVFYDKSNPDIKYVAPVSGELIELNRAEKRAIKELVILADKEQQYRSYQIPDLNKASREELVKFLLGSGAWPLILQRPFNIVPEPEEVPRDIFISTFDTAPLAPDYNFIIKGQDAAFQKGLDVLTKLTEGKVHLGLNANPGKAAAPEFTNATGVEKHYFMGEHPAGNVGIQIHHIAPINAGDKVWTLGVQEVITLGRLFLEGKWDMTRVVAMTGAEIDEPGYIRVKSGANIGDIMKHYKVNDNVRIISGDVLTGTAKTNDEYLDFHTDQITVVAEGDYYEMFGWLFPQKGRPSHSRTFPNFMLDVKYTADTNTHGERRAFVVTGEYEDVLPIDTYPQELFKAILANDFEQMEGLGIYELVEEDVALCEFVCTSKQPCQEILRQGMDLVYEQS